MAELFALADVRRWRKLARKREKRGAAWCFKKGFGKERRELEATPIDPELATTQEKGRARLAAVCRSCPLTCELAGK